MTCDCDLEMPALIGSNIDSVKGFLPQICGEVVANVSAGRNRRSHDLGKTQSDHKDLRATYMPKASLKIFHTGFSRPERAGISL